MLCGAITLYTTFVIPTSREATMEESAVPSCIKLLTIGIDPH
jgi:hypothetical protein